jgi:DNA-binding CsgD family transcriptional regulator/GAF domain-containing protein
MSRHDLSIALGLVGSAYEAAAEPSRWPTFLHALADATDCEGTVMWLHDAVARTALLDERNTSFVSNVRIEPHFLDSYAAHYTHTNLLLETLNDMPEGTALTSSEIVSDVKLHKSEFYGGWLRPQGVGYLLGGPVLKRGNTVAMISLSRPERAGPFEDRQLDLLQLLMPHLRRACLHHQRLTRLRSEHTVVLTSLDLLPTAVWLLDVGGRVLFANRAGHELDTRHDGLWLDRDGLPTAADPRDRQAVKRSITSTIAAGRGVSLATQATVVVRRRRHPEPLQVMLYPLCPDAILPGSAAAMFIFEPEKRLVPEAELLRTFYGLTSAEAQLACALAQGETVESYGERQRLTANTVRTHVKRALAKTGTHQQSQLVALMAKLGAVIGLDNIDGCF